MKPKFVSLKWKLSLSFVLMVALFVGAYVALAKKTFEDDKISYIFETQQRQVNSMAASTASQIERVMFDARSIISGFDPTQKKFAQGTQPIFWEHPQLLALHVQFGPNPEDSMFIEKAAGLAKDAAAAVDNDEKPTLTAIGGDRFAIDVRSDKSIRMVAVFELKNLLTDAPAGQSIAFASPAKVIRLSQNSGLTAPQIEKFLTEQPLTAHDTTLVQDFDGYRQLVSIAQVGFSGFRFLSFVEERKALGALKELFHRSIVFTALSFFASIILALLVSNRLTQNVKSLTASAEKVGAGDFSARADFDSNDEIGQLARTFSKMALEIQRLLTHMVDKIRMETELNTARLVQDSLFPANSSYSNGKVRLSGMYKTTTECGGDWWYYYQKGEHLYVLVADATGHGIPAALITAAARSVFAFIRDRDVDLKEIAEIWDKSVFECSNGKVYMTAFLLQINVELGDCRSINSSHEPPALIARENGKPQSRYLANSKNHALGERAGKWLEDRFQLAAGDRIVLITDGLLAIKSPEGKSVSEKRFLSLLNRLAADNPTPADLVSRIDNEFQNLGQGQPLPDDVTVAVIDFGV